MWCLPAKKRTLGITQHPCSPGPYLTPMVMTLVLEIAGSLAGTFTWVGISERVERDERQGRGERDLREGDELIQRWTERRVQLNKVWSQN